MKEEYTATACVVNINRQGMKYLFSVVPASLEAALIRS
jgi:hypothetical protein